MTAPAAAPNIAVQLARCLTAVEAAIAQRISQLDPAMQSAEPYRAREMVQEALALESALAERPSWPTDDARCSRDEHRRWR
jgi:hypothetical protein